MIPYAFSRNSSCSPNVCLLDLYQSSQNGHYFSYQAISKLIEKYSLKRMQCFSPALGLIQQPVQNRLEEAEQGDNSHRRQENPENRQQDTDSFEFWQDSIGNSLLL